MMWAWVVKERLGRGLLGLGWVLACLSLALGSEASAQEASALYLLPTASYKGEVSSVVPPKIDSVVKDRLAGRPKVKLVARYAEEAGKPANAAIQEAKDSYNSGIGLLVAEDFEGAAKAFQKAVTLFEANLADVDSYEILVDAQLRMGLAYTKAGFDLDAKTALKAYANMSPGAKLDPKDYPAEVVDAVEKELRRMEKRGAGVLKVGSTPEGAEVLLDGQSVGTTPLELKNAASGQHYLVVKGKGAFPFAQKITVRGKGEVEEFVANLQTGTPAPTGEGAEGPLFLVELERRLAAGEVDGSMAPYLTELTSRTGARFASFVVMRKGKAGKFLAYPFVFSQEAGKIAGLEPVEFDGSLATVQVDGYKLSEAIVAAVTAFPADKAIDGNPFTVAVAAVAPTEIKPGPTEPKGSGGGDVGHVPVPDDVAEASGEVPLEPLRPTLPEEPPRPGTDDDKWYTSWWVWTVTGVVLVSGGVVGGMLLLDTEAPEEPRGFSASVRW